MCPSFVGTSACAIARTSVAYIGSVAFASSWDGFHLHPCIVGWRWIAMCMHIATVHTSILYPHQDPHQDQSTTTQNQSIHQSSNQASKQSKRPTCKRRICLPQHTPPTYLYHIYIVTPQHTHHVKVIYLLSPPAHIPPTHHLHHYTYCKRPSARRRVHVMTCVR